jgi:hypothetical protein
MNADPEQADGPVADPGDARPDEHDAGMGARSPFYQCSEGAHREPHEPPPSLLPTVGGTTPPTSTQEATTPQASPQPIPPPHKGDKS